LKKSLKVAGENPK